MSFPCRIAGLSPLLLVVLLAACAGDGGSDVTVAPGRTPTFAPAATTTGTPVPAGTVMPGTSPAPSPAATPSPSPEPEAPHAAPIEPDPAVVPLGENVVLSPPLRSGALLNLDPIALAEGMGITPPPCAALVFYISWQVRHPYPPTDVDVDVYWMRMGGRDLIGEGPSGQASSGCGEYQVVNNSDTQATVEVGYLIGELTG